MRNALLWVALVVVAGCAESNVALRPGASCDSSPAGLEVCRSQCDANQARACYRLGWFYESGQDVAEDVKVAVDHYHKACLAGFAVACRAVGIMLWTGDRVVMNKRKALAYYRRACGLGLPEACPTQAMVDESENRKSEPGAELKLEMNVGKPSESDASTDTPSTDTPSTDVDSPSVDSPSVEGPKVEPPSVKPPSL